MFARFSGCKVPGTLLPAVSQFSCARSSKPVENNAFSNLFRRCFLAANFVSSRLLFQESCETPLHFHTFFRRRGRGSLAAFVGISACMLAFRKRAENLGCLSINTFSPILVSPRMLCRHAGFFDKGPIKLHTPF